ncbi:NADH dehydrogenase [Fibrisoma limi BUZ 3]|uniref:NADH dehydrogenase n=1 Tax=Fibrisoma limi BUZ 3 TaxID=1185876 RepID=I2GMK8_9BACT|nr:NAD(P)/FAD-dependent oxidoreductase [Fibrisoma limi]CCH55136.1 NADH dehydrogenase [Fibrisoma limi BUZ 3]
MNPTSSFDVIIIGGSYAGLSAAMTLGRSLRTVLIIDSGKPCNRQTPHSHGFLTRDGETPGQIAAIARDQVLTYPTVSFLSDKVTQAQPSDIGFSVETQSGHLYKSRKLLLATGLEDIMPDIPGFAECWGRTILHCPYCHGYEVHGQPLGILANGDMAHELVRLIQNWSPDLTLFTNGPATLTDEQRQFIEQLGVPVDERSLTHLIHQNGRLAALAFTDGSIHELNAVFSRVPFRQHSDLAVQLGCKLTEMGLIKAGEMGQTDVPGLFVAGDNSTPFRQVAIATANGVKAGAWMNKEMIEEDIALKFSVVSG